MKSLYKNVSVGIISILLFTGTAKTQTYVSLAASPSKTASYSLPANHTARVVYFYPQNAGQCRLSITGGIFKNYTLELPQIHIDPYADSNYAWPLIVGPSTIVCSAGSLVPALLTLEVRKVTSTAIISK